MRKLEDLEMNSGNGTHYIIIKINSYLDDLRAADGNQDRIEILRMEIRHDVALYSERELAKEYARTLHDWAGSIVRSEVNRLARMSEADWWKYMTAYKAARAADEIGDAKDQPFFGMF